MNILLLSVGTRNQIVRYFKETLHAAGRVVATDMSKAAPALYEADAHYIVPRITDPHYIEDILDICRREKIDAAMSLIDPELELLAKNSRRFSDVGTLVVGSSPELCALAMNKMALYRWMKENEFPCLKSYDDAAAFFTDLEKGDISFPVFVKPVCGSASILARKVTGKRMLEALLEESADLMIQEYADGGEIGADVYIDMLSGQIVSIFTKRKLVMRAGETDKSVSFKDPKLFDLIERFVSRLGCRGEIDIDLFEIDGSYYISELNPRFGGGYLHAYECGCNHMQFILNNVRGETNERHIGNYDDGIYMMKYSNVLMKKL